MASVSIVSDEQLDPGSRALLDLTLRRGVSDEQLGEILGVAASEIALRRERAIEAVIEQSGIADLPVIDRDKEAEKADAAIGVAERMLAESRAARDEVAERAAPAKQRTGKLDLFLRFVCGGYLALLLAAVVIYKAAFIDMITTDPLLTAYGLVVCGYIVTRFIFSMIYRSVRDAGLEPRVAIVMPGFNEEDAIGRSLRSLLEVDYPAAKLEIVAVNDGSTDQTLAAMQAVAAEEPRVQVIDFPENRGKRAAMAAGIRATNAEIVAFVDSDSILEPDALRKLMQGFADPKVGAMCGHA